MKIKSLILGMLSFSAVVACTQEQIVTPKLDVDKTEVSVEAVAGEATINVTSNVEWKASSDADWISVNPSSGKGAEKAVAVKITAEDNDSEQARTATVIVEAGDLEKTVKVTQAGKSKEPDPEPGPGPEPGPEYTLDGKQWVFTWSAMNVEAVADLGVTQEGTIILAVDGAIMGMTGY
ncbi:MAG: BACON domain-containing protein, partial [Bacteroidales bacterium]|nr:BACON domain-containing protein [Bacteroidales bacterium]